MGIDIEINDRTKGLDDIVCKIERIGFTMMMNTETWLESIDSKEPCNRAPDDGIAIIERAIGEVCIMADEPLSKKLLEIPGSSYGFDIFIIAGMYLICKYRNNIFFTSKRQAFPLIFDLLLDDALPDSFLAWLGQMNLQLNQTQSTGIGTKRHENSRWLMIPSADDDRTAVFHQVIEKACGNHRLMIAQRQGIHILQGDKMFTICLNTQLPTFFR